jgi:serine protease Do
MRSGPGTSFARLLSLTQRTPLFVTGQTGNCAWLKVKTQAGREGWVARTSGATTLVTLNKPCASAPTVLAPTPAAKPAASSAPKPQATATAVPQQASPLDDPNLGCYQMENYLGVELNVTLNAVNWSWRDNFKVAPMGAHLICLAPGKYTYTIDAPPPWANINGELNAQAGDRLRWPIAGRP